MKHAETFVLFTGLLLSAVSTCLAADIELQDGSILHINETDFNRSLPHAFHDQALTSLPHLYPEHELLVDRRSGRMGETMYALIVFTETPTSKKVRIQAVAVHKRRAWRLESIAPLSYGNTLVIILENIAKLPVKD